MPPQDPPDPHPKIPRGGWLPRPTLTSALRYKQVLPSGRRRDRHADHRSDDRRRKEPRHLAHRSRLLDRRALLGCRAMPGQDQDPHRAAFATYPRTRRRCLGDVLLLDGGEQPRRSSKHLHELRRLPGPVALADGSHHGAGLGHAVHDDDARVWSSARACSRHHAGQRDEPGIHELQRRTTAVPDGQAGRGGAASLASKRR